MIAGAERRSAGVDRLEEAVQQVRYDDLHRIKSPMATTSDRLHYPFRLAPILIKPLEDTAQVFADRTVLHIVDRPLEVIEQPRLIWETVERFIDLLIDAFAALPNCIGDYRPNLATRSHHTNLAVYEGRQGYAQIRTPPMALSTSNAEAATIAFAH